MLQLTVILDHIARDADEIDKLRDNPPKNFKMHPDRFCNPNQHKSQWYSVSVSTSQYCCGLIDTKRDTVLIFSRYTSKGKAAFWT